MNPKIIKFHPLPKGEGLISPSTSGRGWLPVNHLNFISRVRVWVRSWLLILLTIFSFQSLSFANLNVVAHSEVLQGRCFIVFITNTQEVSSAKVIFNKHEYNVFPYENGLRAIVPTYAEQKPGEYSINVEAVRTDGKQESTEIPIIVSKFNFSKSFFSVPAKKKKLYTSTVYVDEWAMIEKLLLVESPKKLWDGMFAMPVPGITTQPFGTKEIVNKIPRSYHRGWDLRAAVGTKVLAPNSGVVIVAEPLQAFGGTVVIDHGQGVSTLYFHLSKINAKVGQSVKTGDVLGLSGNTGISSGPHLHFGMSVHNVRVEPKQWVMTVMP